MREYLTDTRERMTRWFTERAHGAHAKAWLAVLAFTESSFFVIPPDALLVAILLAGAERWQMYALLTTLASVAGATAGYLIGWAFFATLGEPIITFYDLGHEMELVGTYFDRTAFWTMLVAAFTPIPYKVFVLAAGFFKINPLAFVAASLIGRGVRFYLVAYIVRRYGPALLAVASRYATIVTYAALLLLALYVAYQFA